MARRGISTELHAPRKYADASVPSLGGRVTRQSRLTSWQSTPARESVPTGRSIVVQRRLARPTQFERVTFAFGRQDWL